MTFTPDPTEGQRVKATSAEWLAIRAEKVDEQVCRVCYAARATEAAHLVPRGRKQEGDDVADNIVGLCLRCHDLVDAYDRAACSALRRALSRQELAYVVGRKGRGWLDQRFPWDASLSEGDIHGIGGAAEQYERPSSDRPSASATPSESDETCPRCKGKGKVHKRHVEATGSLAMASRRLRRTWSVAVPKTELGDEIAENGADILDSHVIKCADTLAAFGDFNYDGRTPAYYVIEKVLGEYPDLRDQVGMLLAELAKREAA